jgi:phage gpG-like protein
LSPEQFAVLLQTKKNEFERYAQMQFPTKAANIALRFINGNFRAGGFQGQRFEKWKKNKRGTTTLVKSGSLRAATSYSVQPGQVLIFNRMAYAKVHNEGFKGKVTVKAHKRNVYTKAKVGTGKFTKKGKERMQTVTQKTGERMVKSHIRKVDIPQRQFMPIRPDDSPVLNNAVMRDVSKDLMNILNL